MQQSRGAFARVAAGCPHFIVHDHNQLPHQISKPTNPRFSDTLIPQLIAAKNGHSRTMRKLLVQTNIDVDRQSQDGSTPLLVSRH